MTERRVSTMGGGARVLAVSLVGAFLALSGCTADPDVETNDVSTSSVAEDVETTETFDGVIEDTKPADGASDDTSGVTETTAADGSDGATDNGGGEAEPDEPGTTDTTVADSQPADPGVSVEG